MLPVHNEQQQGKIKGPSQTEVEADFLRAIIIANLPQLVLSMMYSLFNRVISTFALSKEVCEFSIRPKGLRVSSVPKGAQRSEYFLQLPYRFALPIMLYSGFLHWLCSESFFLVSVVQEAPTMPGWSKNTSNPYKMYDPAVGEITYASEEMVTWGYAPQAILILALLATLMLALTIGFGSRRSASEMPISGICSAVISAMCHQPADEDGDEAVLKPLRWGVSSERVLGGFSIVETSFSSREIRPPTEYDTVQMTAYEGPERGPRQQQSTRTSRRRPPEYENHWGAPFLANKPVYHYA
jgi:hypothetical protein